MHVTSGPICEIAFQESSCYNTAGCGGSKRLGGRGQDASGCSGSKVHSSHTWWLFRPILVAIVDLDSTHLRSSRVETSRAGSSPVEPGRVESSRVESCSVEPSRAESSRVEPSQVK